MLALNKLWNLWWSILPYSWKILVIVRGFGLAKRTLRHVRVANKSCNREGIWINLNIVNNVIICIGYNKIKDVTYCKRMMFNMLGESRIIKSCAEPISVTFIRLIQMKVKFPK